MPSLLPTYNFGEAVYNENPNLTRQLSQMYTKTATITNSKASRYATNVDAPSSATPSDVNKNLDIGDLWVNSTSDTAWIMTSRTTDVLVTWKQIT